MLILKLVYSLSKEIYTEKYQNAECKTLMQELFGQHLREKSQSLLIEIITYFEQLRTTVIDLSDNNKLAESCEQLINTCKESSAIELAMWILKLVALQNKILPQFHMVIESKVVKLATDPTYDLYTSTLVWTSDFISRLPDRAEDYYNTVCRSTRTTEASRRSTLCHKTCGEDTLPSDRSEHHFSQRRKADFAVLL